MSIQDIVDVSGHKQWRVNLANIITDGDFLSRDINITKVAILLTGASTHKPKKEPATKNHQLCQEIQWNRFCQKLGSVLNCRTL